MRFKIGSFVAVVLLLLSFAELRQTGHESPSTTPSPTETWGAQAEASPPNSSVLLLSYAGTPSTKRPQPEVAGPARSPAKRSTPKPLPTAVANASGPITFYAARDNDPPGSRVIAYPGLHKEAGGTGTFTDPLTFAAAAGTFKPGTKVYVPDVQRYFILEDGCASCSGPHIDLWAGPATDAGVIACEESLTRGGSRPYQVNPPTGLPVLAGDLYRDGTCFKP
jgi:3D (Asp-Asp-Asp) domain-containing protein